MDRQVTLQGRAQNFLEIHPKVLQDANTCSCARCMIQAHTAARNEKLKAETIFIRRFVEDSLSGLRMKMLEQKAHMRDPVTPNSRAQGLVLLDNC